MLQTPSSSSQPRRTHEGPSSSHASSSNRQGRIGIGLSRSGGPNHRLSATGSFLPPQVAGGVGGSVRSASYQMPLASDVNNTGSHNVTMTTNNTATEGGGFTTGASSLQHQHVSGAATALSATASRAESMSQMSNTMATPVTTTAFGRIRLTDENDIVDYLMHRLTAVNARHGLPPPAGAAGNTNSSYAGGGGASITPRTSMGAGSGTTAGSTAGYGPTAGVGQRASTMTKATAVGSDGHHPVIPHRSVEPADVSEALKEMLEHQREAEETLREIEVLTAEFQASGFTTR